MYNKDELAVSERNGASPAGAAVIALAPPHLPPRSTGLPRIYSTAGQIEGVQWLLRRAMATVMVEAATTSASYQFSLTWYPGAS